MPKRVLLAGLFHETHTFLAQVMRLADFQELSGGALFSARGDSSPLAGVLAVADECQWDVTPIIDLRATPGALVADEVVERFWSEFERIAAPRLVERSVDGIFLVLHGAMVSQSIDDVEGELIVRIRKLPGATGIPICGVLDLHGNISRETIELTQGLVAYRCNPHTDAKDAAINGARLLDRIFQTGRMPTSLWAQPGIIWPPTGVATNDDPMRSLERLAREIEAADSNIGCVNVMAGFSFADTPDTGVSFALTTFGDRQVAESHLQRLVDWSLAHREEGNVVPPSLDSVMPRVIEHVANNETPVVLVEPADNIGGGAPGDTTDILRALLQHEIANSVVVINDPESVTRAIRLGVGSSGAFQIGGKSADSFCEPVEANASVLSCSDGRFTLEDPHSHLASMCGNKIDMGPSAVIQVGGVRVLLTTNKTPPFDLGQLRSQGIEPTQCAVIGVKAAVAHRRAYDPITRVSYTVDTSGPCSSDLRKFLFRKARLIRE